MPFDEGTGSRRARRARRRAGVRTKEKPKPVYTPRADTGYDKSRVAKQGRARDVFEKIQTDQGGQNEARKRMAQIQAIGLSDVEKKDFEGYTRARSKYTQREIQRKANQTLDRTIGGVTGLYPSEVKESIRHPIDKITGGDLSRKRALELGVIRESKTFPGGYEPAGWGEAGMGAFPGFGLGKLSGFGKAAKIGHDALSAAERKAIVARGTHPDSGLPYMYPHEMKAGEKAVDPDTGDFYEMVPSKEYQEWKKEQKTSGPTAGNKPGGWAARGQTMNDEQLIQAVLHEGKPAAQLETPLAAAEAKALRDKLIEQGLAASVFTKGTKWHVLIGRDANALKSLEDADDARSAGLALGYDPDEVEKFVAYHAKNPKAKGEAATIGGRIGGVTARVFLRSPKKAPEDVDKYLEAQAALDPNEELAAYLAPKTPEPMKGPKTSKRAEIINIPRAIRASMDISAPFRQGLVLGARHPIMFTKNWKPMIEALKSEGAYTARMQQLYDRPTYELGRKAGLALTDIDHKLGPREENLIGMAYAERIRGVGRGVRASGRAYVTFLNKFRADAFDNYLMMAKNRGLDVSGTTKESKKLLEDIAEVVNTATGRGNIKSVQGEMPLLNGLLFSPRLMLSRVQILNPQYYAKLGTPGKRLKSINFQQEQALKQLGATIGEVTFALKMAEMAGADVEIDPRSSDFGKIKFGDTRIDIMGGLQQYSVLYARLLTRQTKNEHGEIVPLLGGYAGRSPYNVLQDFMENKAAPVPGTVIDYLKGETGVGEPFNPVKDIPRQFIPIGAENTAEAFKEGGLPVAAATAGLGEVGFGVDTYKKSSKGLPRTQQGRLDAKLKKEMTKVRARAKKRGWDVSPEVEKAVTLKYQIEGRVKALEAEQRKAKNTKIPEGDRFKLTPKQRYAAVITALRDYVPDFDYESAEAAADELTPEGLLSYADDYRAFFYGDTLKGWDVGS